MLRVFLIGLLVVSAVVGGSREAYAAYRAGHSDKAFRLYRQTWQTEHSTKAAYNLAVFYEQGIGISRDLSLALKYYRIVEDRIVTLMWDGAICDAETMLPYYRKTLRKLSMIDPNPFHIQTLHRLDRFCAEVKRNRRLRATKYLKLCPAAASVPPGDRIDPERYDCELFVRYPDTMKRYLRLYRLRKYQSALAQNTDDAEAEREVGRIQRAIRKSVKPLLRYASQKEERCLRKARTVGDRDDCILQYSSFADYLMGREIIAEGCGFHPNPVKNCEEERRYRARPLREEERSRALDEVRRRFQTGVYVTGY